MTVLGAIALNNSLFVPRVPPKPGFYLVSHAGQPGEVTVVILQPDGKVLALGEGRINTAEKLVNMPLPYRFGPQLLLESGVIRLETWS